MLAVDGVVAFPDDGGLPAARRQYEASLAADRKRRVLLKLADVAWKEGDRAEERRLREKIYGSLISPREP